MSQPSPVSDRMTTFVALLRAVNVGGTGKLPMTELKAMCEAEGFDAVRTYIASGNVVFRSPLEASAVKAALEARLAAYAAKPVGVVMRTADEMRAAASANPFADKPGNRVVAIFLDEPPPPDAIDHAVHVDGEEMRLGDREIYVFYAKGMADSKLRIPAAKSGTARNVNSIGKLADMAEAL